MNCKRCGSNNIQVMAGDSSIKGGDTNNKNI